VGKIDSGQWLAFLESIHEVNSETQVDRYANYSAMWARLSPQVMAISLLAMLLLPLNPFAFMPGPVEFILLETSYLLAIIICDVMRRRSAHSLRSLVRSRLQEVESKFHDAFLDKGVGIKLHFANNDRAKPPVRWTLTKLDDQAIKKWRDKALANADARKQLAEASDQGIISRIRRSTNHSGGMDA